MSGLGWPFPRWSVTLLAGLVVAVAVAQVACGGSGGAPSAAETPQGQETPRATEGTFPVQTFPDQGREHLATGQTFDGYNSDPPTSGPHAPGGGPQPLDEAGCLGLRDRLAAIVEEAVSQEKEVLMAPYRGMEHRIALTAWRNLDAFDEYDEARVRSFVASFERRFNPEGF